MDYNVLIKETAEYTEAYMGDHDLSKLRFHNTIHIKEVVAAVERMARYYRLDEKDSAVVIIAAYFHDVGYCSGGKIAHEQRSADLAEAFLKDKDVDGELITAVRGCILATQMPQAPKNILEEIVCDADLFHFGSDWFEVRNKLMRQEAEGAGDQKSKEDWRRNTIRLMQDHTYHTQYARELLDQKKQQNIDSLKKKEAAGKKKSQRPDRGIETMFRITSTNNQRLSDMADNKSNILITVNSIILSVVIALLLRKLEENAHFIVPTVILLSISLATMVIAILATRPSIPKGHNSADDLVEKKINLLFFGNFHRMDLENYTKGMKQVMEDRDFLYDTLIKDVYSQGVVLSRKFKLLRVAYSVFMYGLILSVLVFLIVVFLNN